MAKLPTLITFIQHVIANAIRAVKRNERHAGKKKKDVIKPYLFTGDLLYKKKILKNPFLKVTRINK